MFKLGLILVKYIWSREFFLSPTYQVRERYDKKLETSEIMISWGNIKIDLVGVGSTCPILSHNAFQMYLSILYFVHKIGYTSSHINHSHLPSIEIWFPPAQSFYIPYPFHWFSEFYGAILEIWSLPSIDPAFCLLDPSSFVPQPVEHFDLRLFEHFWIVCQFAGCSWNCYLT